MFSGLRQAVAIGIIALSFQFVVKQRIIPFVALVLLASTMHVSAVLFLIYYPLCNWIEMTNKKYTIASIIFFVALFSLKSILTILLPLIFGEDKYMGYIDNDSAPAYNLTILLAILWLFTFCIKQPSLLLRYYRMALFCATCCQSLGILSQTGTRIAYYFILFISLALPQVISELNISKANKGMLTFGLSAFMIFFFFYSNSGGYLDVIPYYFYWE